MERYAQININGKSTDSPLNNINYITTSHDLQTILDG